MKFMKRILFLYSAMFLGLISSAAQDKKETKEADKKDASLLWKISGKNLDAPSWLFGTIHLICPDNYLWTPAMQKAFKSSGKVAFELDMDNPALGTTVSSGMLLKEGKTLKDFFTEADYEKLSAFSEDSLGISLEMFQNMQPFVVMSVLSMKAINCPLPDSYEGNISQMADSAGKEIVGLETAEDQLAIFEKMNKDSMAKQLVEMVDEWDSIKVLYQKMMKSYENQDLAALYEAIISSPDSKGNLNTLLYERNEKWIPEIEKLAGEQATFIAVGAGHLWGDKGLIHLLREEGYTVEPVH